MKMLFVVLLLAGIVFPSAVHSQEYLRREIMVNVIDPCLMHSVRREGLGEFVSEEEALALMKIYMEDWVLLYEAKIMQAVRNKTFRQRKAIYEFSYNTCVRQGG